MNKVVPPIKGQTRKKINGLKLAFAVAAGIFLQGNMSVATQTPTIEDLKLGSSWICRVDTHAGVTVKSWFEQTFSSDPLNPNQVYLGRDIILVNSEADGRITFPLLAAAAQPFTFDETELRSVSPDLRYNLWRYSGGHKTVHYNLFIQKIAPERLKISVFAGNIRWADEDWEVRLNPTGHNPMNVFCIPKNLLSLPEPPPLPAPFSAIEKYGLFDKSEKEMIATKSARRRCLYYLAMDLSEYDANRFNYRCNSPVIEYDKERHEVKATVSMSRDL